MRFVAWWPPVAVADNPLTHEPATEVQLALRPGGAEEDMPLEMHRGYVCGQRVLGVVPYVELPQPISPANSALPRICCSQTAE